VSNPDLGHGQFEVDSSLTVDDLLYDWTVDYTLTVGDTFSSITGLVYYSYGAYVLEPRVSTDLAGYTPSPCPADKCVDDLIAGDLVITEIMFNPAVAADADNEWFEVYNATGGTVSLNGLVAVDDGGNTGTITSTTVLPAGGYVTFGISDGSAWAYTDFTPASFYGTSLALGNSGDQLTLQNSAGVIDAAAAYAGDEVEAGVALQLNAGQDDVGNDDIANWCASTTAIGASGDFGTPAVANETCAP
jgi:hypothetical protein